MKKPIDTKSTATKGKAVAIAELKKRGAFSIEEIPALHRKILLIKTKKGKEYKVIVKAKTSGTWQGSTNDGNLKRINPNTVWLFVDLSVKNPQFFLRVRSFSLLPGTHPEAGFSCQEIPHGKETIAG